MPLYIADYQTDTQHLSTFEHGAYLLLLMFHWQRGSIPSSDAALRQITRVPREHWLRIKRTLEPFFDTSKPGIWTHKRVLAELAKAEAVSERRAAAACERHHRSHTASATFSNEINGGTHAIAHTVHNRTKEEERRTMKKEGSLSKKESSSCSEYTADSEATDSPYTSECAAEPIETENGFPIAPPNGGDKKMNGSSSPKRRIAARPPWSTDWAKKFAEGKPYKLSKSWEPSTEAVEFAEGLRMSEDRIDKEIGKFKRHYLANGTLKADWDIAFQSWCEKALEMRPVEQQTVWRTPTTSGIV